MDTKIDIIEDSINIPEFGIIRENEERRDGGCAVVFDPASQKYAVAKHTNGLLGLFSGGINEGEEVQKTVLREIVEESGLSHFLRVEKIGEAMTHYYNHLKNVNRVAKATCFLIILKDRELIDVHLEKHETFTLAWATAEEILSNWQERNAQKDHDHWIYFFRRSMVFLHENY